MDKANAFLIWGLCRHWATTVVSFSVTLRSNRTCMGLDGPDAVFAAAQSLARCSCVLTSTVRLTRTVCPLSNMLLLFGKPMVSLGCSGSVYRVGSLRALHCQVPLHLLVSELAWCCTSSPGEGWGLPGLHGSICFNNRSRVRLRDDSCGAEKGSLEHVNVKWLHCWVSPLRVNPWPGAHWDWVCHLPFGKHCSPNITLCCGKHSH